MSDTSDAYTSSETNCDVQSMSDADSGSDEDALEQLEDDINTWLQFCRIAHRIVRKYLAPNTARRMVEADIFPNSITLNILLNSYGFCLEEKTNEAVVLLNKIIGLGFQPDVTTWNTLINGLCRSGNAEVALRFYREVGNSKGRSDLRFKPYLIFYSALIHGFCKEGLLDKDSRIEEARELFDLMEAKGHKRNVVSYTVLINGYCKCQKVEEAMRLFKEMVSRECKPNVITFTVLLAGLFQVRKVEDARTIFAEMKVHEVTSNSITYDTLLGGPFKNNCVTEAMKRFHTLERCSFNLVIDTYNCVLD
ncbi:unnamed protein product [Fraxinus pennsylvanica]|uniref:Pentatricopeptide repeat-containing protein n=1 Tax=Fraxinus pennsylvanica TaxID=56036 RepID=A0AAD2A7H9_9LAMI|nr:unnamed protein product [Fraxinus pennsylvanica]